MDSLPGPAIIFQSICNRLPVMHSVNSRFKETLKTRARAHGALLPEWLFSRISLMAALKNTKVHRCHAARSVVATGLHLALASAMGNFSRRPWLRAGFYGLVGHCRLNSYCPSQRLNSGRLRPITFEKQPSIRSTMAPPRPSRAKPPAHCKGSPLAT